MDGRWSLLVSAGLLGGLSGCQTLTRQSAAGLPDPNAITAQTQPARPAQQAAAAIPSKPAKLKPATQLTMGALAEQMADDTARPAHERDQFRAQARQGYQKAVDAD